MNSRKMAKKTKSFDLISMQREKLRLMKECSAYEKKLLGHFNTLRERPVQMAISSVLPFAGLLLSRSLGGIAAFAAARAAVAQ